jgi:hypothetical protein
VTRSIRPARTSVFVDSGCGLISASSQPISWPNSRNIIALYLDARRAASPVAEHMTWEVECRKRTMLLWMGLKICLDEDFYGFLAGVYLHSDRCAAKIYLMATTVLASNNRVRHFPPPLKASLKHTRGVAPAKHVFTSSHAHSKWTTSATRRVQNGLKDSKSV